MFSAPFHIQILDTGTAVPFPLSGGEAARNQAP
jgi:hypothetical protein